jgi:hypothetical protein
LPIFCISPFYSPSIPCHRSLKFQILSGLVNGFSECLAQTDVWPGWEFTEATFVAEVRGEIDASSTFVATESVCCARRHGVTKAMMIEKMILDGIIKLRSIGFYNI